MIRQGDTNKPLSIALYYFQHQVNQRGSTPWQFNERAARWATSSIPPHDL